MNAERFFAGLAILSFALLVLLLAWPRKRPPAVRPTVPASRWPPHVDP